VRMEMRRALVRLFSLRLLPVLTDDFCWGREKNLERDVDNLKSRYHKLRDEVETLRDKVENLEALVSCVL